MSGGEAVPQARDQRVEPPSVAAATYGVPRDNAFHLGQHKILKEIVKNVLTPPRPFLLQTMFPTFMARNQRTASLNCKIEPQNSKIELQKSSL